MKKGLFLIAISLLFVACTPKNSAFRYFDKGDIETNAVRNTKKADIIKDDAIEATLMATYLNKFDPKISQKEENFLVYIYFPNLEEQIDFSKNGYELLLNGKTPNSIEKLERDDKKYEDMMLRNFWGNYYLVKFNPQDTYKLNLKLTNKSSSAQLNFEK